MSLKMMVLAKQVPDTKRISGQAMKEDGTVNRAALPTIFNPDDFAALEIALQMKEKYGGTVTLISMGPPQASEVLRQSLYRGADDAYLVSDRAFAGSDTLATAYTLANAIKLLGGADVILAGRQAIDGDTAQVGPQVAEKLGIPQVTFVDAIDDVRGKDIFLTRGIEGGFEKIRTKLPCLITVPDSAAHPRPPRLKLELKYKKYRTPFELGADAKAVETLKGQGRLLKTLGAADLKLETAQCGFAGSPTKVHHIESIVLTAKEIKKYEPSEAGVTSLIRELIAEHTLG